MTFLYQSLILLFEQWAPCSTLVGHRAAEEPVLRSLGHKQLLQGPTGFSVDGSGPPAHTHTHTPPHISVKLLRPEAREQGREAAEGP